MEGFAFLFGIIIFFCITTIVCRLGRIVKELGKLNSNLETLVDQTDKTNKILMLIHNVEEKEE